MNAQLETQDTEVRDISEKIGGTAEGAYDLLLERREAAFAAAIEPLDSEREALAEESAGIEESARTLELLLPAAAREAQREADRLMLDGKADEAAAKLEESKTAAETPGLMRRRQREIAARIEQIGEEKKAVARCIFDTWYAELQHVIRASEHGLFIGLLDKARDEMYAYQNRHGLQGTLDHPYSFLVKDSHLQNLTAHERSAEWNSASRWYGGRR